MKISVLTEDKKWFQELKKGFKGHDLISAGYRDEFLATGKDADIVLLDAEQAHHYGVELVTDLLDANPTLNIIMITPLAMIETGVQAVHSGASLYVVKPVEVRVLKELAEKLASERKQRVKEPSIEEVTRKMFVGRSAKMERILRLVNKVSDTESTVLITGESGTGKELIARLVHQQSRRAEGPFVAVNCGAIHENLVESELFGHIKGSFTGAIKDKQGLFQVADGGTLFLDEIGDLPLASQVKVLRFLQDKHIRRVGDTLDSKVDTRILAATNKDLQKAIEVGDFREDLFFRLNVIRIHMPPLRERMDSLPHLIKYFIRIANLTANRNVSNISREAEMALIKYEYPGNIRELESVIQHAVTLADGTTITVKDLPEHILTSGKKLPPPSADEGGQTLAEVEKRYIQKVLVLLRGNKGDAAKRLGVSRSTLWRKIREYKINGS